MIGNAKVQKLMRNDEVLEPDILIRKVFGERDDAAGRT